MTMPDELEIDMFIAFSDSRRLLLDEFNELEFSAMVLGSTVPPPEHAITSIRNSEPETRASFLNTMFLLYLVRKREKLEINSTNPVGSLVFVSNGKDFLAASF